MESNDLARLPRLGHKVASQYMALENEALRNDPNTTTWHIMPKLHMFQHIADAPCSPKEYWCYRDETVGGELAHLFRRRSGKKNPATNVEVAAREPFPCHAFGLKEGAAMLGLHKAPNQPIQISKAAHFGSPF